MLQNVKNQTDRFAIHICIVEKTDLQLPTDHLMIEGAIATNELQSFFFFFANLCIIIYAHRQVPANVNECWASSPHNSVLSLQWLKFPIVIFNSIMKK